MPGDDPFHFSQYVYHLVNGLQGGIDPRPYFKVAADCKHFSAYDLENWEGLDRFHFAAQVSQQDLSEYYLSSRAACVMLKLHPSCATCASTYLLQVILRNTWGFDDDRWVTSGCWAFDKIFDSHNRSLAKAAAISLKAGTDIDCGSTFADHLPTALKNQPLITRDDPERAFLMRLGYFDPPEPQPCRQLNWSDVNKPEAQALAYWAAVEGLVPLKNVYCLSHRMEKM